MTTPGPWEVYGRPPSPISMCNERIRTLEIAAKSAGGWIAQVQVDPNIGQSGEANARLIAAAPDLLAVAKLALELAFGNIHRSEHGVIGQIMTAITKAEQPSVPPLAPASPAQSTKNNTEEKTRARADEIADERKQFSDLIKLFNCVDLAALPADVLEFEQAFKEWKRVYAKFHRRDPVTLLPIPEGR